MNRLQRIAQSVTSIDDVYIGIRAIVWAAVLPAIKRVIPVQALARLMCRRPRRALRDFDREQRIVTLARWGVRLTRWRSGGNCLERGLIAYRFLTAAGAQPMLMVGVGKVAGKVAGHAWVVVDGEPLWEHRGALATYTPVFAFAADGSLKRVDQIDTSFVDGRTS